MKFKIPYFLLAASIFTKGAYSKKQGLKPNIFFILTDDQRRDASGYAGNHNIQTPEIHRLAASKKCSKIFQ